MSSLNLSTNGPSISKSYQSVVNAQPPSGSAAQSATYGQWAVFSVSAPLANAFQQDSASKESVLKVQSTGEGELVDLIDEFSDGRIQFAYAKIKDPNTTLPKSVLIGWCGEGVPERTKGYFTSHMAAVSKTLQGYHVSITARSDRDLSPESIVQKVSEASGSRYGGSSTSAAASGPPPPMSSKPAFTPTRSSGGASSFNPLSGSRAGSNIYKNTNAQGDGWGEDAPPITRTQLEKVAPAYQPTKVNLREPGFQSQGSSTISSKPPAAEDRGGDESDVVRGGYQPVGKVDIAAIRRQAQQERAQDDRPVPVKGAYEPTGRVDIAAIRARAQPPPPSTEVSNSQEQNQQPAGNPISERSAPFSSSERLTSLPRPKVSNRFGSGTTSFSGTKAPAPGGFGLDSKPSATAPAMGVGRSFAGSAGKSPAQLWAEKKAREQGSAAPSENTPQAAAPAMTNQTSGGGQWKSGYQGKSWAPVQTTKTGQSAGSVEQQDTGDREAEAEPPSFGGVGAIRDRFKNAPIPDHESSAPAPPPLDTSNKPNAGRGVPMPGLPARPSEPQEEPEEEETAPAITSPPPQPPRSPTPPTPPATSASPIRIAMPVGKGPAEVENAREEQGSPPPAMPVRSLAEVIPHEDDLPEEQPSGHDPARAAGTAAAAATFGTEAAATAHPGAEESGKHAIAQYDYTKAEDNELELREGEHVTDIEMIDENWWMGQNSRGETGLFPSNHVELVEDEEETAPPAPARAGASHFQEPEEPESVAAKGPSAPAASQGPTATALYDYEAGEDNELSFPDGAKITGIAFPDEDWWSGEYGGHEGLFPASYVQLDE